MEARPDSRVVVRPPQGAPRKRRVGWESEAGPRAGDAGGGGLGAAAGPSHSLGGSTWSGAVRDVGDGGGCGAPRHAGMAAQRQAGSPGSLRGEGARHPPPRRGRLSWFTLVLEFAFPRCAVFSMESSRRHSKWPFGFRGTWGAQGTGQMGDGDHPLHPRPGRRGRRCCRPSFHKETEVSGGPHPAWRGGPELGPRWVPEPMGRAPGTLQPLVQGMCHWGRVSLQQFSWFLFRGNPIKRSK